MFSANRSSDFCGSQSAGGSIRSPQTPDWQAWTPVDIVAYLQDGYIEPRRHRCRTPNVDIIRLRSSRLRTHWRQRANEVTIHSLWFRRRFAAAVAV